MGLNIFYFLLMYTGYLFLYNLSMFILARFYGVQVEKFYIWFDTWFRVFRFKIGQTEYGLGWLPLGGYIKISGMVLEEGEQLETFHFKAISPIKQIFTILAGPVICLIIGVYVYMLKLDAIPSNYYVYTIGFFLSILVVLIIYGQIAARILLKKSDHSKTNIDTKVAIMSWVFIAVLLLISIFYIQALTPFFDELKAMFNGEQELSFSSLNKDSWYTIIAFFGVWFYLSNILPLGGLNGSLVVSSLYQAVTGEQIPDKLTMYYRLITLPIIMGVYIYLLYLLYLLFF
ncbi:MAG: hypothetical protein GQ574_09770 [Crocinitomix sp.]|nr:hypothetical protein [Crocinitomix sp.]